MKTMGTASFLSNLSTFNEAQKAASTHIEGTMLVIAGPGTGKTQVLAARIGNILQSSEAQASPENVLCITFTNAGVLAMRKRLLEFIGPDAYRITIETFHSFCNRIIQENPECFSQRELRQITEIEEITLIRKIIDGFPTDHRLKRFGNAAYYDVNRLKNLYSLIKTEAWDTAWMKNQITLFQNQISQDSSNKTYFYVTNQKQYKKGDPKAALKEKIDQMESLKSAIDTFHNYQSEMEEAGLYDFNDMLGWTLNAFQNNENLLRKYQERYLYILVDEFQDSNDAQNKVVSKLCEYWSPPNLFVVGDDDQSIYRFQGANIRNLLEFRNNFQDIQTVVLTQNYRSSQPILDAATQLIQNNSERIINIDGFQHVNKALIASSAENINNKFQPNVFQYPNNLQECAGIVQWLKQLKSDNVPLTSIAILYREHKQADDLIKLLQTETIPFSLKRNFNVLEDIHIQQIIKLFEYVSAELRQPGSKDYLLYEILHFPWILSDNSSITDELWTYYFRKKEYSSLRELIRKLPYNPQVNIFNQKLEKVSTLKKISLWIETAILKQVSMPLQQWLEWILTESDFYAYCFRHPERQTVLGRIRSFFDWIKEESRKNPNITPIDLIRHLNLMHEYQLKIEEETIFTGEPGVVLSTTHGSKGLEWDYVWMMDCQAAVWERRGNPQSRFTLPDTLVKRIQEEDPQAEIEESRRLFFVGMTRAKKSLTLSYSQFDLNGKELMPVRFIRETGLQIENKSIYDEEMTELLNKLQQNHLPLLQEFNLIDNAILDEILADYSLSVTHLNHYLECPISFYFDNLIRIPSAKNASMAFGSAVHRAYQKYFQDMKQKGEFASGKMLIDYFAHEIKKEREAFTPEDLERRILYGQQALAAHHQQYHTQWKKKVALEKNISTVVFDGIPLKGFIDKMEYEGNKAWIVDYKTGKYKKEKFIAPQPDSEKQEEVIGGDYWRQAAFYYVLYQYDMHKEMGLNLEGIGFDFIEPDEKSGKFNYIEMNLGSQDIKAITQQIKDVYSNIKNKKFQDGCGTCFWCQLKEKKANDTH